MSNRLLTNVTPDTAAAILSWLGKHGKVWQELLCCLALWAPPNCSSALVLRAVLCLLACTAQLRLLRFPCFCLNPDRTYPSTSH